MESKEMVCLQDFTSPSLCLIVQQQKVTTRWLPRGLMWMIKSGCQTKISSIYTWDITPQKALPNLIRDRRSLLLKGPTR